jgi:hypothetical protein
MISMKLTPAEAKAETMLGDDEEDGGPQYPYGLTLCIDDEMLAKLGIDVANLPAIGSVFYIEAKAEVCSTSQYANQNDTDTSISLQITDMSLSTTDDDAGKPDIANRLYGR